MPAAKPGWVGLTLQCAISCLAHLLQPCHELGCRAWACTWAISAGQQQHQLGSTQHPFPAARVKLFHVEQADLHHSKHQTKLLNRKAHHTCVDANLCIIGLLSLPKAVLVHAQLQMWQTVFLQSAAGWS